MNLKDQLDALLDATAFDSTGTKVGAVRQVYVDDASGKMTFATVTTGIFSADAIVPLHGARLLDDELHVDHTRNVIRDSPRPDRTEDGLTPDQESRLLEYYGIDAPARESAGAGESSKSKPERTPRKDTATEPPSTEAAKDSTKDPVKGAPTTGAKTDGEAADKPTGKTSEPTARKAEDTAAAPGKAADTGPTADEKADDDKASGPRAKDQSESDDDKPDDPEKKTSGPEKPTATPGKPTAPSGKGGDTKQSTPAADS